MGHPGMMNDRAVVVIETDTVLTLTPLGVTDDGVTIQVPLAGAPVQLTEMGWLNPPSGLITNVKFADCPAFTVAELEEAVSEKSIPIPERLTA